MQQKTISAGILLALLFLVVIGGILYYAVREVEAPSLAETNEKSYASTQGFSATYPGEYVLIDDTSSLKELPILESISLYLASEYEELLKSNVPREGPRGMHLRVFTVPSGTDPRIWIDEHPTYFLKTVPYAPTNVDGKPAVAFATTGLYEGDAVALVLGTRLYVFSVDWIAHDEEIVGDFRELLTSVRFN